MDKTADTLQLPLILDRPSGLPRSLFPFHSYGTHSGLGNLAVRRIVQDSIGFLWVGTEDGLYRYDGNKFAGFGLQNGLPSTWINDILATPEGDLWVCTPQGLAIRNGDKFRIIGKETGDFPGGSCHAVVRDGSGVVWIAHRDGLFFRRGDRFQRFTGLPAGLVNSMVSLPGMSSSILVSMKGAVIRINEYRVTGSVPVLPNSSKPVDSLAVDRLGRIWAQSERKLHCLLPGTDQFRDVSRELPTIFSRGVLTTDRSGRLWVPTEEGISCIIGDQWQHFGLNDGLPTSWAIYVFEDREGSLWVASIGVHRLIGRGSWTSWTRAQGLPSDTIWDVYRDRNGQLWVATDKGLCLATPDGWRVLPGTEKAIIRRIYEDARGRLWLGLMPAAILRYNPANKELLRYGSNSGVAGVRVLCIEEDGDGNLWAATDGAGLLRYRPETNDFLREKVPEGTPEETFRFLLRDSRGRLWVTGQQGLLLRDGGKWRRFSKKDGLLRNHVSYIAELHSGDLCLSYFEPLGIIRFKFNGEKLQVMDHISRETGLASNKVYLIGEDLKNNLWVGTGSGIDVFSPQGVLHFSRDDGVAGDDIDAMALLVDKDGALFIGTSSGLSLYRSDTNFSRIQAPKPIFLRADLADHPLASNIDKAQQFSHKHSTFDADFAVLDFLHESQIEFGVRLRGLETEWHKTRSRESRYPGLSPGSYVYEVRSRIGSGPWSNPASVSFEIRPPWWKTWQAIAALLILIGSAAVIGFRWRLQHLRSHTRQLEQLISARTNELAAANADLERLSITDPLTGLKNRRFLEFSIAEDLARIRRIIQPTRNERSATTEEIASISFLLMDIDYFKQVNDSLGHAAGDLVLRQMGSVLSSAVRETDTTIRWGGEEFLVIARGSKECDSAALAERIRNKIASTSFAVSDEKNIRLTCSLGFASWPFFGFEPDAVGWQEILALADRCLYLAKNSGRNAWIGIAARPDYKGNADPVLLNDLWEAEAEGIIDIQSFTTSDAKAQHYPLSSHEGTGEEPSLATSDSTMTRKPL
jgi:diguanylate cyclase (GGDEF)-like protein